MAAPTANATTRALSNFDIAEQIILWLPLREMLFSNRVCKAWKAVYDHPSRVRKALFLSPATENRIYYPDCSKSTWYMAPDRSELDQAGLLSAPAEESDDDITLTNSPKRLAAQSQRPESTTEAESAETAEAFKGKRDFSFTPEVEAMIAAGGTEGKVGIMANVARGYGKGRGSQAAGGKQAGGDTETAKQQIDSKSMAFYHSELSKSTATKLTELADHTSNVRIPDELVDLISKAKISAKVVDRKSTLTPDMMAAAEEGVVTIQNNVPRSLDGTMMVSRVTPPFLNPFCELFVDLFHEGACGRFVHAGWVDVPGRGRFWYDDLIIQPPSRLPDGSVPGKSSNVRAVQRYNASWRKMHPLSANTASIIVECFSHGFLTLRPEFAWALLAGEMMEQLGTHWAHECPKCCVTDYWFGKLIKKVGKCDCGKLGVRKLELDQIGWHVIAELSANEVQSTGQQDRIVPLGAYGS